MRTRHGVILAGLLTVLLGVTTAGPAAAVDPPSWSVPSTTGPAD
jgi:hypothetical protein